MANSILAACTPQDQSTSFPSTGGTAPPEETQELAPAATQLAAVETTSQLQVTVSPDDPAIEASDVEFDSGGETIMGYLARPSAASSFGEGPLPVILVCHENRGLTEHIKDVTRRLAVAGYVGLAVDLLSRQGGTASMSSDDVPGALGTTSPDQFVQDFTSGWRYLQDQPFAKADRVGMVGFCFGGGVTWLMATRMPELLAAVPFYGPPPPIEDVPNINAAVLAIYGERDDRINQTIPQIEAAMQENNKIYEKVIYPNADHAFHNDTGQRYNPQAARDAWRRTLEWFGRYVKQT